MFRLPVKKPKSTISMNLIIRSPTNGCSACSK